MEKLKILTIKTGWEKHANRLFTTQFYLIPKGKDDQILLIDHPSYMAHERIICGLNGCFGQWEIGHVSLPNESRIMGLLTRKIIVHDPHNEADSHHLMLHIIAKTPGQKNRTFSQKYWGYNGGKTSCDLLVGSFDILDQSRDEFDLKTPLDKLPF